MMSDFSVSSEDARRHDEEEEADVLRRQRRLRRILKKQGDTPSFSALLVADLDKDDTDLDDDEDDLDDKEKEQDEKQVESVTQSVLPIIKSNRAQTHLLIDIDFELGLKDAPNPLPKELLAKPPAVPTLLSRLRPAKQPSSSAATASATSATTAVAAAIVKRPASLALPQDEGWYEGIVSPLAFPAEDAQYLSDLHCFTRGNMELFSVTQQEAKVYLLGQRRTIVQGRVGVRCIHCADAAAAVAMTLVRNDHNTSTTNHNEESKPPATAGVEATPPSSLPLPRPAEGAPPPSLPLPPPAAPLLSPDAIAFPRNIKGLHSACSQKLQVHLEQCPNLPLDKRAQLQSITQAKSVAHQDDENNYTGRSTKRLKTGITGALYYMISAKRIGLVDANNDSGIRFGRDLALEPYPLEAIRAQMEDAIDLTSGETAAARATAISSEPRITAADEESERVLAAAIMERDDPDRILGMSADMALVTDFIFLAIRQMAICHALPADFGSRGKKTKLMRVGFAGFCCRHCTGTHQQQHSISITAMRPDYSCRSFSSAADNLSSAISNSFTSHLLKCPNVPVQIKKALLSYKRLHQRQMAQLPYGSQRRLFLSLFSRLRSKDKSEEEMQSTIKSVTPPPEATAPEAVPLWLSQAHDLATTVETNADNKNAETLRSTQSSTTLRETYAGEPLLLTPAVSLSSGPDFPVCDESETKAILKNAEEDWDPAVNDGLILQEDRQLVSDYVFLTMRQLKKAIPTSADVMRIRRSSATSVLTPGVCCVHCFGKDDFVSPSGRSFPSAADNFASAFNSSLYNHMQACPFVPVNVKRSLANLRKIHSAQCSKKFGAQRRYFNILYARLLPASAGGTDQQGQSHVVAARSQSPRHTLSSLGFLELPTTERARCQLTLCSRCRMVPVQFRARGAIFTERPSLTRAKDHYLNCKGSELDLTLARDTLKAAATALGQTTSELAQRDSFKELVGAAVGGHEELCRTFSLDMVVTTEQQECNLELWKAFPDSVDFESVQKAFQVVASELEGCPQDLRLHPDLLAYMLLIAPGMKIPDSATESSTST
jgi:hypothetical protein